MVSSGAVHLLHDAAHDVDGARRARHNARAQRGEVELAEARVLQFGDKHGGHAVDRGAALLGNGLERGQRVKVFRRNHHGRAVRDAHHVAQHHAEAVIRRAPGCTVCPGR